MEKFLDLAKKIAFGIAILSGVIYLGSYCVPLVIDGLSLRKTSSIAIIGGADGPTAIFVTRSVMRELALPAIFVVSLSAWLFFRWKSKKSG